MTTGESPLITHARRELELAGMFDLDADYGPGAIAGQVLELVEVFAKQQHSGGSAAYTLGLFEKLARLRPLSPLTSEPEEWIDRSVESGEPLWQSRRCPSVFSRDGGKTWYDLDASPPVVGVEG